MTFAEYNTDLNFDDNNSSLEELVKIGLEEGKDANTIKASLSPKWQKSKKIGEFDSYVKKYSKPKTETAPEPKAEETKPVTTPVSDVTKQKSAAANVQNADLFTQQNLEKQKVQEEKNKNWDNILDSAKKMYAASKNIDDHYIEQLPTSIYNRYKNGEFGEVGSKDAKQRLAYFIMDELATPLKALANGMSRFAGQGDRFADTSSAYDKYQESNLAKGLENRWKKYETETANAMDLLKQRSFADEEITEAIDKISANNRLQTAFNRASEENKAYILEVMTEVGDKIGNMNDTEFVDTIMGMAAMGESLDYKEAAGMLLYRFIKDPEKRTQALKDLGFDVSNSVLGSVGGGLLGGLGGGSDNGEQSESDTPASAVKLSDGTVIDAGKAMSFNDFSEISNKATDLSDRYYRGEITEEQFREDYNKLYNLVKQHNIMNKLTGTLVDPDKRVKQLKQDKVNYWDRQIEDLNEKAKNGLIKTSEYADKFAELEKSLIAAGGDAKKTAKKKLSTEDSRKAVDKINKAKSKKK